MHLPMQAANHTGKTEPDYLTMDMSRDGFSAAFEQAFSSVPHAIGVNNHRGSLLTRHPGSMRWLMEEISARKQREIIES